MRKKVHPLKATEGLRAGGRIYIWGHRSQEEEGQASACGYSVQRWGQCRQREETVTGLQNPATLQEPRNSPPSEQREEGEGGSSAGELLIHGHPTEEYQTIYYTLVDSMACTASGRTRPYSLELGLRIKQRLWETLRCPTLREEEQPDGQLGCTEGFSSPTLRSFAPLIEVDISEEPVPKHPQRPQQ
ncbi:hypothetical protein AOLI_G00327220 [Acnodon oligacanthus]